MDNPSNISHLATDPPKNRRPRVTSVRVKTKGLMTGGTSQEEDLIIYSTEGQNFEYYGSDLQDITVITISHDGEDVRIPAGDYMPAVDPSQGFMQSISEETVGLLAELGHNVTVNITFATKDVPMAID